MLVETLLAQYLVHRRPSSIRLILIIIPIASTRGTILCDARARLVELETSDEEQLL